MKQGPPLFFSRYLSFKRNWFSCNKVGHKAIECINPKMGYSFNRNYDYCNKVGHNASEYRSKMNININVIFFNGYYYVCNAYGHKFIE